MPRRRLVGAHRMTEIARPLLLVPKRRPPEEPLLPVSQGRCPCTFGTTSRPFYKARVLLRSMRYLVSLLLSLLGRPTNAKQMRRLAAAAARQRARQRHQSSEGWMTDRRYATRSRARRNERYERNRCCYMYLHNDGFKVRERGYWSAPEIAF